MLEPDYSARTHSALDWDRDNDVFEGAGENKILGLLVLLLLDRESSLDFNINADAVKDTIIQLENFQHVFPQFSWKIHCHEKKCSCGNKHKFTFINTTIYSSLSFQTHMLLFLAEGHKSRHFMKLWPQNPIISFNFSFSFRDVHCFLLHHVYLSFCITWCVRATEMHLLINSMQFL